MFAGDNSSALSKIGASVFHTECIFNLTNVKWKMSASYIILLSWPFSCQKLSKSVKIWH